MNYPASTRPTRGTLTGRVWEIADEITRRTGQMASRRSVVTRVVEEGGNANTANTQYQHWKAHHLARAEKARSSATPTSGDGAIARLRIAPDGRLLVPQALREAMMLGEDGYVTARVVDGELRVISLAAHLARTRRLLASKRRAGVSAVDELIAERRREARREDGDHARDDA